MLSFITSIWGKIAGIALLVAGLIAWLMLRDARMMRKGAEKLKSKQRDELDQRLDKRESDESDIRRTSDDDLLDELSDGRDRTRRH